MNNTAAPLTTWRGSVLQEWVDFNGHLRDAFYMLLFSFGGDGLMDLIGLDEDGRAATGHSMFTLECHVNYLQEVRQGAAVEVRTQIIGHDAKRLHLCHGLHLAGAQPALAMSEQMYLNIDMAARRSTPFAPTVLASLRAIAVQHAGLPRPDYLGRVIALPTR